LQPPSIPKLDIVSSSIPPAGQGIAQLGLDLNKIKKDPSESSYGEDLMEEDNGQDSQREMEPA